MYWYGGTKKGKKTGYIGPKNKWTSYRWAGRVNTGCSVDREDKWKFGKKIINGSK